jgi:hypothetical protein
VCSTLPPVVMGSMGGKHELDCAFCVHYKAELNSPRLFVFTWPQTQHLSCPTLASKLWASQSPKARTPTTTSRSSSRVQKPSVSARHWAARARSRWVATPPTWSHQPTPPLPSPWRPGATLLR